MKAVIDTNVLAYYVLRTEGFSAEARALWLDIDEPMAPASWKTEFANTVWLNVQHAGLDRDIAIQRLRLTMQLGIVSVDPAELWEGALQRSIDSSHPVYDTLFVELAVRESAPLATFDQGLLTKFPDIAKRPRDIAAVR